MSDAGKPTKAPKVMPKGGRKGGAIFPRMNLETAVSYAKRLVSKTHTGPQAKDIIYSGVLDAKGSGGDVKISALKQYGFSTGDAENGFGASEPAKKLASAPPEELTGHYRSAALRPKIFKALFDTYHGDLVTHAKLKQRTADLNVHPDQTEACVDTYLASFQLAGLVVTEGDAYRHLSDSHLGNAPKPVEPDEKQDDEKTADTKDTNEVTADKEHDPEVKDEAKGQEMEKRGASPRAIFNVNVTLDSSLDTEKLQKQLELLKKFGAI
jgi:hypothetical protein